MMYSISGISMLPSYTPCYIKGQAYNCIHHGVDRRNAVVVYTWVFLAGYTFTRIFTKQRLLLLLIVTLVVLPARPCCLSTNSKGSGSLCTSILLPFSKDPHWLYSVALVI